MPCRLFHDFRARAQPQVEGVAQHDLRADLFQFVRHHGLDAAIGAHRHEDGRLDHAVVQRDAAAAGAAVGGEQFEIQSGHGAGDSINMASP
jgi:hypothetical protein